MASAEPQRDVRKREQMLEGPPTFNSEMVADLDTLKLISVCVMRPCPHHTHNPQAACNTKATARIYDLTTDLMIRQSHISAQEMAHRARADPMVVEKINHLMEVCRPFLPPRRLLHSIPHVVAIRPRR